MVRQHLVDSQKEELHGRVDAAFEVIADHAARAERGEEPVAVAKAEALEQVHRLFSAQHMPTYVWIHDLDGRLLMHPLAQYRDGQVPIDPTVREVIAKGNATIQQDGGEGFISYSWNPEDQTQGREKLSFVKVYQPWGWVIGSGQYLDAIHARVGEVTDHLQLVLLAVLGVSTLLAVAMICNALRLDRRRRQTEESWEITEEKFRVLADCGSDGIALIMEDRLEYANPALLDMLGYDEQELASLPVEQTLLTDAEGNRIILPRTRTEQDGLGRRNLGIEVRLARKDGSTIDVILSPSLVRFQGVESIILAITDITQRKADDDERNSLRQQYLQSQKMEAIGRLAGGIAHDFRNQLTVINGYTSMLMRKTIPGSPVRRPLEQILKSTARSGRLANQLLSFSRKQPLKPVPTDINHIVADLRDSMASLVGEDIHMQVRLDESIGLVMCDDGQLEQALMNLLVNARDAMPAGGDLVITTTGVWLNHTLEPCEDHAPAASAYLMVSVSDTGLGMYDETREQIFEPFFTTKEEGKGTGLGLATVYSFVQQSNGSIKVESAMQVGTTFRLFFPETDRPVGPRSEKVALSPGKTVTGTILVVEDDDAVRHLVVNVLRSRGHHVIEACDARHALPLGEHYEGQIDLLVTDIVMPGMDGMQLAKRLLEVRPEMKLLFMTGYTDRTGDLNRLIQDGADVLVKPFSPDAMADAAGRLLAAALAGPDISQTAPSIERILRDQHIGAEGKL